MMRWLHLLGIILLIFVGARVDWNGASTIWSTLNHDQLFYGLTLASLSFLSLIATRVLRFEGLLAPRRPIPRSQVLAATIRAGFFGMVTPGRIGDITRIWMLQKCQVGTEEAFAIWIYERGLDVASLLALACAAWGAAQANLFPWWAFPAVYLILFLISIAIGLPLGRWLARHGRKHLARFPGPFARLAATGNRVEDVLRWQSLPILATAIALALSCCGFISILMAVWPEVPFDGAAMSYALGSAAAILPISIGGLGVREAGIIGILGLHGVPAAHALTASLADGFILPVAILLSLMPFARLRAAPPSTP